MRKRICEFLDEMEKEEVKVTVQAIDVRGSRFVHSNMNGFESLGAIEYHKTVIVSGISSHQFFDSYVQSVENRPDLVRRLHKAMDKGHDCEGGHE